MIGRIVIEDVRPRTPDPGHSAKAVVGQAVVVRAGIFTDGHDILAARVLLFDENQSDPRARAAVLPLGNDAWAGTVTPDRIGPHRFVVQAWTDRHATWAHKVAVKLAAAQPIDVEIAEGVLLVGGGDLRDPDLAAARAALEDGGLDQADRVAPTLTPAVAAALAGPGGSADLTSSAPMPLWVDRERALVGAWYELFPRSYGGFRGVEGRVPALAAMGFDVLYLPPVHPIGSSHRKGRNNTLDPGPDDPGSPWAIGSSEGGHTAIDAGLGTFDDFAHLLDTLRANDMEVALDYALQCSPDHPWVHRHPEWFHHRPDGSIAYAENPPKKYQDIYPINFWPDSEADRAALWAECKAIVEFWVERGVKIFRVDNPHTKPVAFWEWMIPAVLADHPDVLFLAEAFTRPRVMAKLAEVGFSQSYTYFTWRTEQYGPEGLDTYLEELARGPVGDYMRPNFWPNTPDILAEPLRNGPPAAFALRFALAATLSPSYGVYSGYELYENSPASETNEEYLDSEKFEVKERQFDRPGTLVPFITAVNVIRRRHPALARLQSIFFHRSDNPLIVAYSKVSDDGSDVVLVVVTLDPVAPQETLLHLDLEQLGLAADRPFSVTDELSGELYLWTSVPFVRLDPSTRVAHILDVRPGVPGGR